MKSPTPYWKPEYHADRRPRLIMRNAISAKVRDFFEKRGFVEVETAQLQISPGNETHLHAFKTTLDLPGDPSRRLFLHTSPEFALKKLIAAGERQIFSLARVFRNGERSALHHSEFTMLEWYRAHEDYTVLIADCSELVHTAAEAAGCQQFHWRGKLCDPFAPVQRLSVKDAFEEYACIDLLSSLSPEPVTQVLAEQAIRAGIRLAPDDTWSDIFSRILSELIEPNLGIGQLTALDEYPSCEAALARKSIADPRISERFELYACGIELANAFGELTDPVEQRARFQKEMREKDRIYGETYPIDEDFLAALGHMPPTSGIALGLDRLVMLCVGATHIEDVLWTQTR